MRSALVAVLALLAPPATFGTVRVIPGDGASLQRTIDAHPGQPVFVPAGDYVIDQPLLLTTDQSGLWGPGRTTQSNPEAAILNLENVSGVVLRDLTFTRSEGKMETHRPALRLVRCADVTIDNVQILDNRGDLAAIFAAYCRNLHIKYSYIENYSRIAIDDRTKTSFLGCAFRCIDGTGIAVRHSHGGLIAHNRVVELRMRPTPELKVAHDLGKFVKKNATKGWRVSQEVWDSEYFNGWHQGSAIVVTSGERSGMKAIHGSRNTLILANQFSRSDLWAIGLMPGTASHEAGVEVELSGGRKSSAVANVDGYSLIAGNIISDFGYGDAHWNWSIESSVLAPLRLGSPGFAANGKPLVRDVLVLGNIIQDTGRDGVIVDGQPGIEPPRYRYAVKIAPGADAPLGVRFGANIFYPGTDGVADTALQP